MKNLTKELLFATYVGVVAEGVCRWLGGLLEQCMSYDATTAADEPAGLQQNQRPPAKGPTHVERVRATPRHRRRDIQDHHQQQHQQRQQRQQRHQQCFKPRQMHLPIGSHPGDIPVRTLSPIIEVVRTKKVFDLAQDLAAWDEEDNAGVAQHVNGRRSSPPIKPSQKVRAIMDLLDEERNLAYSKASQRRKTSSGRGATNDGNGSRRRMSMGPDSRPRRGSGGTTEGGNSPCPRQTSVEGKSAVRGAKNNTRRRETMGPNSSRRPFKLLPETEGLDFSGESPRTSEDGQDIAVESQDE